MIFDILVTVEIVQILLLLLLGAVLAVVIYVLKLVQQARIDVQTQVSQLQQNVSQRFDSNVQTVAGHLGIITGQITNTTNVVSQVEGKLGQVQEASRQIFELARQVAALQDILQSPKMRGGLGEFFLADLLGQVLPSSGFQSQFRFASGTIVDAALFIGQKILCVDSKFPLENFRRMLQTELDTERKAARKQFLTDVKKHVDDIAKKYIVPEEDTFDFALMYIPAENVYYELVVKEETNLYEYCMTKKVIPVSPNTFYAYLQVITMGLRGFQISEQAKIILAQLQQMEEDLSQFESDFLKIGLHLRNLQASFEKSESRLAKMKDKIVSMGRDTEKPV